MTDAEQKLWHHLRRRQISGFKFRRQCPIESYIVDFVCFECMLIIEIDGGQHQAQKKIDDERTQYLEQKGFRVIRYWNHQVLTELDVVLKDIRLKLPG